MDGLKRYTVIYEEHGLWESVTWQYFLCWAEDAEHAEEQCRNAYPDYPVLWVNEGENYEMN